MIPILNVSAGFFRSGFSKQRKQYRSVQVRWNPEEFSGELPTQLQYMQMLHDQVMSRSGKEPAAALAERRRSDRIPFPAEIVLEWNHNLGAAVRYQVLDAGDGGYRIHSSVPMLDGTTGMVIRLLPGRGEPLGQPVMVAWCRTSETEGGYEIGVRCF
jgi:hypothetical protein